MEVHEAVELKLLLNLPYLKYMQKKCRESWHDLDMIKSFFHLIAVSVQSKNI